MPLFRACRSFKLCMVIALLVDGRMFGQQCVGASVAGQVRDATNALMRGATVILDRQRTTLTGRDGTFLFSCVSKGNHDITVAYDGFANVQQLLSVPQSASLQFVMKPWVEFNVEVNDNSSDPAKRTISGDQMQMLADDPDDLQRELQQMAGLAGGNSQNAIVSVDGFQGDSRLPPKSSIASIRINPDLFSAEYREPPFEGGRVEVTMKAGLSSTHGDVFITDSEQWLNARDPFAPSRAALGKRRIGFDLSGPLLKKKNDFNVTLERRTIDNFAVVNAVTLNDADVPTTLTDNVATPQTLWLASLRIGLQLGPKHILFASYVPYHNETENVGVGGLSLRESGYSSNVYDHTIRAGDSWTISPHLVHEIRSSFDWRGENDVANSHTPQVQVAGAFIAGGATIGDQDIREFRTETDENVIAVLKRHNIKAGYQLFTYAEHRNLPTNFNGTYIFGGALASALDSNGNPTGSQTAISGLEQYRRTLLNLSGGSPSLYSNVSGNPKVGFTQIRLGLFAEDSWNVRPGLTFSFGFRYFLQNDPTVVNGAVPRFGIVWSPDHSKTWQLEGHLGLFSGQYTANDFAELHREDGIDRVTSLIYNPVYSNPLNGANTLIRSLRTLRDGFRNTTYGVAQIGLSKTIGKHLSMSGSVNEIRLWDVARTVNVNTPLNGDPLGPRPGPANLNVLQLQNSGAGSGDFESVSVNSRGIKRMILSLGAIHMNLRSTADGNIFSTPQHSGSDAGEYARLTSNPLWATEGTASVVLPQRFQLSAIYSGTGNLPYNVTTGADNNGDGEFNDRPELAYSGQANSVLTPFGLLIAEGGHGVLRRNAGSLPWQTYLDVNLQRSFRMTHDQKSGHPQTLTVNVRSSNVLNHINVTQVGNVLGSTLFGTPFAADNGRRIEYGVKYSF